MSDKEDTDGKDLKRRKILIFHEVDKTYKLWLKKQNVSLQEPYKSYPPNGEESCSGPTDSNSRTVGKKYKANIPVSEQNLNPVSPSKRLSCIWP
jgi:hypothetical protein